MLFKIPLCDLLGFLSDRCNVMSLSYWRFMFLWLRKEGYQVCTLRFNLKARGVPPREVFWLITFEVENFSTRNFVTFSDIKIHVWVALINAFQMIYNVLSNFTEADRRHPSRALSGPKSPVLSGLSPGVVLAWRTDESCPLHPEIHTLSLNQNSSKFIPFQEYRLNCYSRTTETIVPE